MNTDATYNLDQFGKAPPKGEAGRSPVIEDTEPVTSASVDDLPTDEMRRIAKAGHDESKPSRFRKSDGTLDRSKALCWLLRECVRQDVKQSVAIAIISDNANGIAASVLDATNPKEYARKQWQKAVNAVGDKAGSKSGEKAAPLGSVVIRDGNLNDAIEQSEAALMKDKVEYFDRGGQLVRLLRFGTLERKPEGIRRDDTAVILRPVTSFNLVQKMEATGVFVKQDRHGNYVPTTPPLTLGQHLLSRPGEWPWPQLAAVVNHPTMRADGSILTMPGFDVPSGLLYEPMGMTFDPIPDQPNQADATAALRQYHALYELCDFIDETNPNIAWDQTASFSAVLSAHLSGLARPALSACPMLVITAPAPGSAKSKVAECIGVGNTGRRTAAIAFTANVREFDQLLYVVIGEGDPVVLIDNVTVPLGGSDPLCQILTQSIVQYRRLGQSERLTVRNTGIVIATGLNVAVKGDLTRRVIVCTLDPKCENPENRKFPFDPVTRAHELWPQLVVAGLTALKAYTLAGCPQPEGGLKALGSFEDWTRLIRGCLVWCGYTDPVNSRAGLAANDPAREAEADLLRTWFEVLGSTPVTVSDIAARGYEDVLYRGLIEFAGVPVFNARSIGRKLLSIKDRFVGGAVLRRGAANRDGVVRWYVESRVTAPQLPFDYGMDADAAWGGAA